MRRRKEAHHSRGFSRMMMRFVPQRILRACIYGLSLTLDRLIYDAMVAGETCNFHKRDNITLRDVISSFKSDSGVNVGLEKHQPNLRSLLRQ